MFADLTLGEYKIVKSYNVIINPFIDKLAIQLDIEELIQSRIYVASNLQIINKSPEGAHESASTKLWLLPKNVASTLKAGGKV